MENPISIHPLFVGLTRPPMRFGVTVTFLVLNGALSLVIFVSTLSFLAAIVFASLMHVFGYVACLFDLRIFDLLLGKLQCMNTKNRNYWHCNSYEPF